MAHATSLIIINTDEHNYGEYEFLNASIIAGGVYYFLSLLISNIIMLTFALKVCIDCYIAEQIMPLG